MPQPSKIIEFNGLGSYWECEILDADFPVEKYFEIRQILTERLQEFSKNYSRFDEKSLISRLNRSHQINNPPTEMVEMFEFARKMFNETDGIFNISVGGELNSMGYGSKKQSAKVQSDFWNNVIIENSKIITPPDSVIDFGGFGKGWLIDDFVQILIQNEIHNFIVNGGGDLYVHSDKPIEINLEHPFNSTMSVGQTKITDGAMAASSIIKRTWIDDGVRHHHIINPTTGDSADSEIIATFVKADSAKIADVMATVLIIKPELNEILSESHNLKTILLSRDQFKN